MTDLPSGVQASARVLVPSNVSLRSAPPSNSFTQMSSLPAPRAPTASRRPSGDSAIPQFTEVTNDQVESTGDLAPDRVTHTASTGTPACERPGIYTMVPLRDNIMSATAAPVRTPLSTGTAGPLSTRLRLSNRSEERRVG